MCVKVEAMREMRAFVVRFGYFEGKTRTERWRDFKRGFLKS